MHINGNCIDNFWCVLKHVLPLIRPIRTPITRDSVLTIPTENHTYNSEGDLNYSIDESASKPSGGWIVKGC